LFSTVFKDLAVKIFAKSCFPYDKQNKQESQSHNLNAISPPLTHLEHVHWTIPLKWFNPNPYLSKTDGLGWLGFDWFSVDLVGWVLYSVYALCLTKAQLPLQLTCIYAKHKCISIAKGRRLPHKNLKENLNNYKYIL
jgi:hypothetical protein